MDRVGTAQREIDGIESAGRPVRQLLGELDRGLAGEVEIAGGVRQPPHLFGRGRDHAFLAVADVDAPQASKSVEQFAPFDIGEIRPLARPKDGGAALFMIAPRCNRMDPLRVIIFHATIDGHLSLLRLPPYSSPRALDYFLY